MRHCDACKWNLLQSRDWHVVGHARLSYVSPCGAFPNRWDWLCLWLCLWLTGRGAGYYIDVGASQLIIDGEIAIKAGVAIQALRSKT